MRIALSIRQPWAWLIVNGHKPVENRDWPTSYLGPVLIHASKTRDLEGYGQALEICELLGITLPPLDDLPKGGIVGEATLHDCVTECDSPWFVGKFGFLLRGARPLPFVPFRGRLGFFNVRPDSLTPRRLSCAGASFDAEPAFFVTNREKQDD